MDIVNLENTVTVLRLKLIGYTGEQQGSAGELILPPNGSARVSGASIFGIPDTGNPVQGYVQIQSTDGRFAGWVRFSDPGETSFGSALQFMDTGLRATYFSHVAQNDMFFTGLAALNPNPGTVTAQITVYDTEGGVIAQSSRKIPSGGRFSKLLPELVGMLPPLSKGYFSMITDQPVASFALFGTLSGDALSVIPPQLSAPAFSCGSSSVSDIDGNHYGTVAIGTQCWMKENLRVTKYRDGAIIPLDESGGAEGNAAGETWSARTAGARTVFSHTNANLTTYGYLYNWHAAIDARGLCPTGWHLPTDAEWTTLTTSSTINFASGMPCYLLRHFLCNI